MDPLFLYVTVVLVAAWLVAELRMRTWIRRAAGMLCAAWLFAVVSWQGCVERLSANWYFTSATDELLEVSVEQLKAGRGEAVLRAWSTASAEFGATYENRGDFVRVVRRAVAGMTR